MIPHQLIWLIMLLPGFAFIINGLLMRPFVNRKSKAYGYITILAIGVSAVFAVWALFSVMSAANHQIAVPDVNWLVIGNFNFHVGIIMDQLAALMVVVVSVVSLMVQIYSLGYMAHDEAGYYRYYTYMSLFTFAMLGLVLADNLLFTYVFWEMVGLCSYLLIGFWFHKKSAADAAKKAFIVTRIGDFGFLIGILILYTNTHTFDIYQLHELAVTGVLGGAVLTWAAIGLFAGAIGKSAQFPLHVWLPDAMEGPTPVSALIHSATMVCAGVFLVARTMPLFIYSQQAITTVAVIGGFTAIFAATMGLVANDIKRVLAYSTISQIGYMMLGLGVVGMALSRQISGGAAPCRHGGDAHHRQRRRSRGHVPPVHPRLLQGAPLYGRGQRQPLHRHFRYASDGRPAQDDALDLRHFPHRQLEPGGYLAAGRFLEQGWNPAQRFYEPARALLAGDDNRFPDGFLHVPRHLYDFPRRVPRRRCNGTGRETPRQTR